MLNRTTVMLALAATLVTARQPLADASNRVIPGDQGERVGQMLGADLDQVAAGCRLESAKIEQTVVRATYTCPSGRADLQLVHPDSAEQPLARTDKLAIVAGETPPPQELVDALVARIRAQEAAFVWADVVPGRGGAPKVSPKPQAGVHLVGATDEVQKKFDEAVALYREHKAEEAFTLLYEVARHVQKGVLGTLVAALASSEKTPERVAELGRQADANPDDPLANFVAGVAAHYYGHQSAPSIDEKKRYYRMAIPWLSRAKEKFAEEPRVWIYLAVSYFRTGEQALAEEAIEKAVALGRNDADAYYCRAEIWHRKDPARAVADMKEYLRIMDENRAIGTFWSEEKERRVHEMLSHMERVVRGEVEPEAAELFDPIGGGVKGRLPTSLVVGAVAGLALLVVGGALLARRRRRNRAG